jgi:hypothetical protein
LSFTTIDSIVFQSGPCSTRHSVSGPIEVDFQFEELGNCTGVIMASFEPRAHSSPYISSTEARAGERLDPTFPWRRRTGAKQIGDLLGHQAGARHPAPSPSRSILPFV